MSLVSFLLLAFGFYATTSAAPALAERALSCPSPNNTIYTTGSTNWEVECFDRNGGDMPSPNGQSAATLEACIAQCVARPGCILVDWVPGPKACYVKSSVGYMKPNAGVWGARLVAGSSVATTTTVSSHSTSSIISSSYTMSKVGTQTSTSTSATPASSSLASTSAGKRGLCFNNAPEALFFGGSGSKVTWMYNWYFNRWKLTKASS